MAIRRNILTNPTVRDQYIQGVKLLKAEDSGTTTEDVNIPGTSQSISTYDLFVLWHHVAMMRMTPANNPIGRNSAHRGPAFAPWHRVMLMILEQNLQRVLSDPDFGLPYWDWAADGDRDDDQQPSGAIWADNCMGGQGEPISSGPFAFDAADPASWRIRLQGTSSGTLAQTVRGMNRSFARGRFTSLPKSAHVTACLALNTFDGPNWDILSGGFRNRLEGWRTGPGDSPPGLHNLVHVWIGGDMEPSTSPNDPVFYLNHCNVDRIWEKWLQQNGRVYIPAQNAGSFLAGHRINDTIASPLGTGATPGQVVDVSTVYVYDSLP